MKDEFLISYSMLICLPVWYMPNDEFLFSYAGFLDLTVHVELFYTVYFNSYKHNSCLQSTLLQGRDLVSNC